ncbi:MAG TPA: Hsp20/alpha crystallin family protein [Myxococcales bacterium]|jgi:HSP20 family protein
MAIVRRGHTQQGQPASLSPRSLQGWDPWGVMREMMHWDPLQDVGRTLALPDYGLGFVPQFEVKETANSYVFKADLPGVKEEDLDISLTGNRLTVSGKREDEERKEGETYYAYERSYGTFTRSFTLPEGIDPNSVNASMKEGVLSIDIPKKPEVQPKKVTIGKGKSEGHAKA